MAIECRGRVEKAKQHKSMKRSLALIALTLLACAALSINAQGRRGPALQFDTTKTAADLTTALNGPSGEYAARALYQAIIGEIGEVQPFVNILAAEETHIKALQNQWTKYFGATSIHPSSHTPAEFSGMVLDITIEDAAALGAEAEKANVAMYDGLLQDATLLPGSVLQVFKNLQAASLNNHLHAFEAVADGNSAGVATAAACSQTCLQLRQRDGTCVQQGQMNCGDCPNAVTGCQPRKRFGQ